MNQNRNCGLLLFSTLAFVSGGCAADTEELEADRIQSEAQVTKPVFSFATFAPVAGAVAKLNREDDGHEVEEDTRELPAGHVVALWYVAYNAPENCTNPIPGLSNCSIPDSQNFATEPTVLWADAIVVGANGEGEFTSFVGLGTAGAPGEILFGGGLTDVDGAEVHYLTRDKGAVVADRLDEQMSSFFGACDVAACQDLQFALIPPN